MNQDLSEARVLDSNLDKDFVVLVDSKNGDLKEKMATVEEEALEN